MDTIVLKDSVTASMTDEEFLKFCMENPDLRIERNSNLEIIIMSPVTSLSGYHSGEIYGQLRDWNRKTGKGIVFDSSAGFTLPDRSVLSPGASWLSKEKWSKLSEQDKNKFAPVCPEFVMEVKSKTDSLEDLQRKMKVWVSNGVRLAWLVIPDEEAVYIFKPVGSMNKIQRVKITGEGPVSGFELDLSALKI